MNSNLESRIEINPQVCHGKPVVRGTRVLVSTVLGALSAGDSIDMVLKDYPNITKEDVNAMFAFASRLSTYQTALYDAVA